jgi:hypothetical protein
MICFSSTLAKSSSRGLISLLCAASYHIGRIPPFYRLRRIVHKVGAICRSRRDSRLSGWRILAAPPRMCMFFLLFSAGLACVAAATPQRLASPVPGGEVSAHFAIADFDGDQQADLATVQAGSLNSSQSRYWIRFRLTSGERQSFGISAPVGGLELSARDVNGDNVPDVIVSTSWLNRPIAILLNNGHGRFALVDPAELPSIVSSVQNSRSLSAPSSNESGALSLSRNPDDACAAGHGFTFPPVFPEGPGQPPSPDPTLPDDLLPHGRDPPSIHHV